MNFFGLQVPELKKFLQDRGITCSLGRKIELVRLCELAEELNLEVIRIKYCHDWNEMQAIITLNQENNVNVFSIKVLDNANAEEEYCVFDERRRTVYVGDTKVVLDPVNTVSDW